MNHAAPESGPDVAPSGNGAEAGAGASGKALVEPAPGPDSSAGGQAVEALVAAMTWTGKLWTVVVAREASRLRSTRAVAYSYAGSFVWEVHVGRRRKARGHDRSLAGARRKAVAHALERVRKP